MIGPCLFISIATFLLLASSSQHFHEIFNDSNPNGVIFGRTSKVINRKGEWGQNLPPKLSVEDQEGPRMAKRKAKPQPPVNRSQTIGATVCSKSNKLQPLTPITPTYQPSPSFSVSPPPLPQYWLSMTPPPPSLLTLS